MVQFLVTVIQFYSYVVLARVILTWLPNVSRSNPIVEFIYQITDPVLKPVRQALPQMGAIDISPLVVLIGLHLSQLGRENEAQEYYNKQIEYCNESIRLRRIYAADGGAFYDMAATFAVLGDKATVYQILHSIENEPFHGWMVWYMQVDPFFESL